MPHTLAQRGEAPALLPARVEIRRVEPAREGLAQRRPLLGGDSEPRGVAVAALHHHVPAENPFEAKAEPKRRGTRGRIAAIAFPLVAAIAQLVEGACHHQSHRLGRDDRALQAWREIQVPDLDRAMRSVDAQVAGKPDRGAALAVDHSMEKRIIARRYGREPLAIGDSIREGTVMEISPVPLSARQGEGRL
jgi:hypothetical protein